MALLYGPDSFETGVFTGAPYDATVGTPTSDTVTVHSGAKSMKVTTQGRVQRNMTGNTIAATACAVYVEAKPTNVNFLADMLALSMTAGTSCWINIDINGVFELWDWDGGSVNLLQTGPTVTLNTWNWVELYADVSANPWTLSWRVNGANQTNGAPALAATTVIAQYCGTNTSATSFIGYFDDWIGYSGSAGDFPIAEQFYTPITPGGHLIFTP